MSLAVNRNLNIVCAITHSALAFLWIYRKYKNYKVPASYGIYENALLPDGNGGLKVSVRQLENSMFTSDMRVLMILFFVVTALFHIIYASDFNGLYTDMIEKQNNMLRWIEYSISSTLMINVISRLAGVNNQNTLKLITAGNVCVMLQGNVTEVILADDRISSDSEKLKRVLIPQITAWVIYITIWNVIIETFTKTLNDVENGINAGGQEEVKIPKIVKTIVYIQLAFFTLFGVVQLYQLFTLVKPQYKLNYIWIEMFYNILSLVSKVLLGLLLAFGIEQTEGRDEAN